MFANEKLNKIKLVEIIKFIYIVVGMKVPTFFVIGNKRSYVLIYLSKVLVINYIIKWNLL